MYIINIRSYENSCKLLSPAVRKILQFMYEEFELEFRLRNKYININVNNFIKKNIVNAKILKLYTYVEANSKKKDSETLRKSRIYRKDDADVGLITSFAKMFLPSKPI
ncbi:hypothetical protein H8356DRAFT_1352327 [Neocallimastix lanati (nom. inval.)]|nr:hypothetical protein H8356DRAFT_1352327 [Neocallimastix sp. JGI-2020a]